MYSEVDDQIIAQGAEAIVKKVKYLGKVCILKRRLFKPFRHKTLDENLTKSRMVAECRSTAKLRRHGVYVPVIYLVDFDKRETVYEFIPGETVSSILSRGQFKYYDLIGENIAKMHNANIIHGDLTTKNMIMCKGRILCIIDFGLSFFSTLAEDKAVDLYVLERCLTPETVYNYIDYLPERLVTFSYNLSYSYLFHMLGYTYILTHSLSHYFSSRMFLIHTNLLSTTPKMSFENSTRLGFEVGSVTFLANRLYLFSGRIF